MMYPEAIKDVPEGDWIALSPDQTKVMDHDPDLGMLLERVKAEGDCDCLITKKFTGNLAL
jgi:hypothetical protein